MNNPTSTYALACAWLNSSQFSNSTFQLQQEQTKTGGCSLAFSSPLSEVRNERMNGQAAFKLPTQMERICFMSEIVDINIEKRDKSLLNICLKNRHIYLLVVDSTYTITVSFCLGCI